MKKAVSMFLAAALAVGTFAGCGSSADTGSTGSAASTESGSTDSAAADGSVFKIGGIGPTTGGAAVYGLAVQHGAEIAVEEINAAGGINGYQVEFKFQDDEADAEKSVNAYNALKDWGAQVLDGSTTSGACIAVTDKTKEDNMFQITPSGSAVECVQYDNNFRVCFSDPNQGLASAQYIGENGLAEKIAVIYDSSDVYSSGIYEKFVKEAENQPFEVVAAEAFTADNKTDFSVQLQKAKDAGADMVFLPIYYQESALILTQAAAMGYAPKWFSCDGMDGILGGVDNFDVSLTEGVPSFEQTLRAVVNEMVLEEYVAFRVMQEKNPDCYRLVTELFRNQKSAFVTMPEFLELAKDAKLFIRTGELRPASNLLLVSASGTAPAVEKYNVVMP